MQPILVPVILCGGAGTRLWPESRVTHPKPFIPLPDGESLIQKTFRRASQLPGVSEVLTVTTDDLLFKTEDAYATTDDAVACNHGYILEPFGRNTAASFAAAALDVASRYGPDAHILILAADHLITDESTFARAVEQATNLAAQQKLTVFGIVPEHPETGYGYIQAAAGPGDQLSVQQFVEKPDAATAQAYVDSGNYYWNSGMFCSRADLALAELKAHAPELLQSVSRALESGIQSQGKGHCSTRLCPEAFAQVPDISIDYALMEKTACLAGVKADIGWSDIGSWEAMGQLTPADDRGNRFDGEVLSTGASNNYVRSHDRLTALVGVEDLLVIDTADALLIAHKSQAQGVKDIVAQLKRSGHGARLQHRTVHRPWGSHTVLEEHERFKVRRIVIKPGTSLTLQMHHHRSEHWVVLQGMARITNEDQITLLGVNESTFIPAGHKHKLENPGVIDLIMVEVQSGDYLGEDDITRYE
ncbi:mannose-1-phosphate guanylyltransferase/mannose-6-phosphate isomerase [Gilvimarinus xylanilyticus]|uniref:mannose-1-phosphate guanylyltransferase n=1 Tax=Gilvimarinus xylanilyticus TaxID=2944139 RepID=A0A9X2KUH2_9GAMM|nr:mannose-1-phosphate guanylyltransferase/mannose-6-phosphate isomerase [Gilvimarinus xylanilyticus]MCP8900299.1 mannose-1-phosphate guanylyltransferase/mannose-6-phosphate isomerase [Gilvimarinus xylanilyticus]